MLLYGVTEKPLAVTTRSRVCPGGRSPKIVQQTPLLLHSLGSKRSFPALPPLARSPLYNSAVQ